MRAVNVARTVAAGVAVLGLVTGCSELGLGGSEPGTPAVAGPGKDDLLDPCTGVADEWLIETGLAPATERDVVNPTDVSSWRICAWQPFDGSPYRIDVLSSSLTIDDVRSNETQDFVREIAVGSRQGLIHKPKNANLRTCYVTLPAEQGMFEVSVGWRDADVPDDFCEVAVKHAIDLEPHLPR
ncbi:DUF3558 domain-containing protein [Nocardia farcinica]|uniref:DUF3558 domain-containing protein n=1 Tax=Nocardia farcinica TaxID=37329 RepID=UPI002458DA89|nr:DUF3558 domain-containing protein [Nocardia farcinica]